MTGMTWQTALSNALDMFNCNERLNTSLEVQECARCTTKVQTVRKMRDLDHRFRCHLFDTTTFDQVDMLDLAHYAASLAKDAGHTGKPVSEPRGVLRPPDPLLPEEIEWP